MVWCGYCIGYRGEKFRYSKKKKKRKLVYLYFLEGKRELWKVVG